MRIFYFQGISFSRTRYPITRCKPAEELKERIGYLFFGGVRQNNRIDCSFMIQHQTLVFTGVSFPWLLHCRKNIRFISSSTPLMNSPSITIADKLESSSPIGIGVKWKSAGIERISGSLDRSSIQKARKINLLWAFCARAMTRQSHP
jgi:hypothetical protein